MPELPEVETIRRTLENRVKGSKIDRVLLYWNKSVEGWDGQKFEDIVEGQRIESLERRGKYLLITLDGGWSLVAHMRMTGRLVYFPEAQVPDKHTHVVFVLEAGELHFSDIRKFGRIKAVPTPDRLLHPSLKILGPEPLEEDFTVGYLVLALARKKVNLKTALLDQTVLAGLGNIYVDEALFLAGLSPERLANSLSPEEIEKLHKAIQTVLQAGIDAQGTSFRDYRDANGEKGSFQRELKVYGRAIEPCYTCGRPLERKRLGGRTTVFCSHCQN
ncbi:MAG: DNA-formamidopyrimidine glycosylase [Desulfitobacterium hafniense]|nr:DNA-formamidopyrimidine glycosylase [Desulfitobacterium hafniense]